MYVYIYNHIYILYFKYINIYIYIHAMFFWMSVFTGVLVAFSCRSSYAWGYLQLKKSRALMPTARPFLRSWSSCKHRLGSLATEILLSGRSTLDEKNFSAGSLCQEFTCRDWQPKKLTETTATLMRMPRCQTLQMLPQFFFIPCQRCYSFRNSPSFLRHVEHVDLT
jgi:hypothetical protein